MQTASFYHMLSVIYLLIIARTIVLVQIDFLFQFVLNHDILQELSNLQQKGGECLMGDIILTFLVSVIAGVVSYYICKWLDRDE